ncbi:ATP-binding protein [Streptacidiphilus sp. EB129]|uniref:ATP-binding protein n=1 Tax=Streptacidiphilus sp. EB129 TaxID=3156262 RepID=UPI003518DECD
MATSVLVAVCSVAATAWLAVTSTSHAIQQQQGQALSDDADIYSTLLGYAATHRTWGGVAPAVAGLAQRTGRRITLTTSARQRLADSSPADRSPLPPQASAVVDPLAVDASLAPGSGTSRIDLRATGPYQLTPAERAGLLKEANTGVTCLRDLGQASQIVISPSGRPSVTASGIPIPFVMDKCGIRGLDAPTTTEKAALDQLDNLVDPCLARQGLAAIDLDLTYTVIGSPATSPNADQTVASCVESGRREQLTPYVAPAALLFVTNPTQAPGSAFDLSRANALRIAEVTALVLAVTVAVTSLVATRLVRPLGVLAEAAQNPTERHARVAVTGKDEISYLATAFNELSQRRERMEEQREAMVSDVAHELRTPLSNIRGWLEAVEDGVAVADPVLVSSLLQEALVLQHIIDDLRDLAAADAGTFRLHPEATRVREVAEHVTAAYRDTAQTAGVTLNTWIDGDPELVADPVRLRQAVGNLVSNGIRHTRPGGSVTVGVFQSASETLIEVADTGSGISPEDLPHVFDRFWRAEKSRNRQTGGSGLGLAIVRQLVEGHAGTVTATSTPGTGSVFTLRLPTPAPTPATRDQPRSSG